MQPEQRAGPGRGLVALVPVGARSVEQAALGWVFFKDRANGRRDRERRLKLGLFSSSNTLLNMVLEINIGK